VVSPSPRQRIGVLAACWCNTRLNAAFRSLFLAAHETRSRSTGVVVLPYIRSDFYRRRGDVKTMTVPVSQHG
jgi:hypothetical protein